MLGDKIYWWIVKQLYYLFYSDKICLLDSNIKYEVGKVLNSYDKKDLDVIFGIKQDIYCNWYETIPSKYHISKQSMLETIILSTIILLFVGFLIYIF